MALWGACNAEKLQSSRAAEIAERDRVDLNDVLWLVLIWVALIVLWSAIDHRHVFDLRRWLDEAVHVVHHGDDTRAPR